MFVGSAVGVTQMKSWAITNGDSRRAEQILAQADFKTPARESVLVQSQRVSATDPSFVAVVADVADRLAHRSEVTNVVSPVDRPAAGLISRDGHSALVQFDVHGKAEQAKDKIAPVIALVHRLQAAHPAYTVAEFGQASADYEIGHRFSGDIGRAEYTSLPLTLLILLAACGLAATR